MGVASDSDGVDCENLANLADKISSLAKSKHTFSPRTRIPYHARYRRPGTTECNIPAVIIFPLRLFNTQVAYCGGVIHNVPG